MVNMTNWSALLVSIQSNIRFFCLSTPSYVVSNDIVVNINQRIPGVLLGFHLLDFDTFYNLQYGVTPIKDKIIVEIYQG